MSTTTLLGNRFTTSVAKELVVGVTGVLLIGFVLAHMAGNLLLLLGPEAFNHYAAQLQNLGELLWLARLGLIVTFVAHISFAISLAKESSSARGTRRYEVEKSAGRKNFATRLMLISGLVIFVFVLCHVYDFTLTGERTGPRSFVNGMGEDSLGLYGVVFSSFMDPVRSLLYILAVCCVGLHLSHAISSVAVTLGFLADKNTGKFEVAAKIIGAVVALGFSTIPVYVMFRAFILGIGA